MLSYRPRKEGAVVEEDVVEEGEVVVGAVQLDVTLLEVGEEEEEEEDSVVNPIELVLKHHYTTLTTNLLSY